MKEIHKVSVVIPIYNVQEYLNECVSSIVNQTYQNLEIILVDDGSPDSCPIMCDAWKNQDDRITVIHKKKMAVCPMQEMRGYLRHQENTYSM